jgi:hypothetical protein
VVGGLKVFDRRPTVGNPWGQLICAKMASKLSIPTIPVTLNTTTPSEFTKTVVGKKRRPKARAASWEVLSTTTGNGQPLSASHFEGG